MRNIVVSKLSVYRELSYFTHTHTYTREIEIMEDRYKSRDAHTHCAHAAADSSETLREVHS